MSDPFVPPPAGAQSNPYAAPTAAVADPRLASSVAGFIPGGRTVDAGRGFGWFGDAFEIFKRQPLIWIGMFVVFFILAFVAGLIPFIGGIAVSVMTPVFMAGFVLAADAGARGEEVRFGHLFGGFERQAGSLITVGAIYLGLVLVLVIAMMVVGMIGGIGAAGLMSGGSRGAGAAGLGLLFVVFLLALVLVIPIYAALYFAPALVVFNDYKPVDAMKASFFAVFKNIVTFIVFAIVAIVASIIAAIPLGLGYLVLGPVFMILIYSSYRDVFYE